jgi:hypothetical protein
VGCPLIPRSGIVVATFARRKIPMATTTTELAYRHTGGIEYRAG